MQLLLASSTINLLRSSCKLLSSSSTSIYIYIYIYIMYAQTICIIKVKLDCTSGLDLAVATANDT